MALNVDKYLKDRENNDKTSIIDIVRWVLFMPVGIISFLITYGILYNFVGNLMCNEIISLSIFLATTMLIAPKKRLIIFIIDVIMVLIITIALLLTTGITIGGCAEVILTFSLLLAVIFKSGKTFRIAGFLLAFIGGIVSIIGVMAVLFLCDKLFPNETKKCRIYFEGEQVSQNDNIQSKNQ